MPAFVTTRPDVCGSEKLLLGLNIVTGAALDNVVAPVVVTVDVVVSLSAAVVAGNSFTLFVFLEVVVVDVVVGPPPLFPRSLLAFALIKLSIAPL
jgi:hypothetical protein